MTKFIPTDLHRIATAAIGALILTTACVGAAVAPARGVEMDRTIRQVQVQSAAEAIA